MPKDTPSHTKQQKQSEMEARYPGHPRRLEESAITNDVQTDDDHKDRRFRFKPHLFDSKTTRHDRSGSMRHEITKQHLGDVPEHGRLGFQPGPSRHFESQPPKSIKRKTSLARSLSVLLPGKVRDASAKLAEAAQSGNMQWIEELLAIGASVEFKSKHHENGTALHVASQYGHPEAIQILLQHGARIDQRNSRGDSAVHVAAVNGHLRVMRMFTRFTENICDMRTSSGETPLHRAAAADEVSIVNYLLEHRADINARTNHGTTPLHVSTLRTGRLLLEAGAQIYLEDKDNKNVLHYALQRDMISIHECRQLLRYDVPVNTRDSEGRTSLHQACIAGAHEVVLALIEAGADIEAYSKGIGTPLHTAARLDLADCVKALVESGADLDAMFDKDGRNALDIAVEYNCLSSTATLLEHGADPNSYDREAPVPPPLHVAIGARDRGLDMMRVLLDNGADPNIIHSHQASGLPALHVAIGAGRTDVVQLLLKRDADVNLLSTAQKLDVACHTPLQWALLMKKLSIAEFLVSQGRADIDKPGTIQYKPYLFGKPAFDDFSALDLAVNAKYPENVRYVEFLVESGCTVHESTLDRVRKGRTGGNGLDSIYDLLEAARGRHGFRHKGPAADLRYSHKQNEARRPDQDRSSEPFRSRQKLKGRARREQESERSRQDLRDPYATHNRLRRDRPRDSTRHHGEEDSAAKIRPDRNSQHLHKSSSGNYSDHRRDWNTTRLRPDDLAGNQSSTSVASQPPSTSRSSQGPPPPYQ